MALIIGAVLALGVGIFATLVGWDRDRSFYPVVTVVVASYYVLFAAMGAPPRTVLAESLAGAAFVAAAALGSRRSLWLVAAALAGHGAFDFVHASLIPDPGVPAWWPPFCAAYDGVAAAYLAWLLTRGRLRAAA